MTAETQQDPGSEIPPHGVKGRRLTGFREVRRKIRRHPIRHRFRSATASTRMLPGFIIIGAQRAATTSLFRHLRAHPEVIGPHGSFELAAWVKELHFFDERYHLGLDWYRAFFPMEARRRLVRVLNRDLVPAEATPYYLFHPAVPPRVAETLPDARFIALLRNPVDRAFSHYAMNRRAERENLSLADALTAEHKRLRGEEEKILAKPGYRSRNHRHFAYFARGLYAEQLERWFEHVDRDRMLILRSEDYGERPEEVFARVCDFLGVRRWQPPSFPPHNRVPYSLGESEVRKQLEERYAEPNERLARLLGPDFRWDTPRKGSDTD